MSNDPNGDTFGDALLVADEVDGSELPDDCPLPPMMPGGSMRMSDQGTDRTFTPPPTLSSVASKITEQTDQVDLQPPQQHAFAPPPAASMLLPQPGSTPPPSNLPTGDDDEECDITSVYEEDFDSVAPSPIPAGNQMMMPPAPPAFTPPVAAPCQLQPMPAPNKPQDSKTPTDEMVGVKLQLQAITQKIEHVWNDLGVSVLHNPKARDIQNAVHEAVWFMRWAPQQLMEQGPHRLVQIASVLASHQVYVTSVENWWRSRYRFLDKELDRVLRTKFPDVDAPTLKDKTTEVLRTFPEIRRLWGELKEAEALAHALEGMGACFAQLENGLKRMIDLGRVEMQSQLQPGRYAQ